MKAAFHALFSAIAWAIVELHKATGPVFGRSSGASWALAIVLLTVLVRGLMYPLFVKQIKTQRAMTALQPKIKELQAKYKTDKETLNQELMKLYKEHNANPFSGCLPLILQMPIFISLFQVLKQLGPTVCKDNCAAGYDWPHRFGVSAETAKSLGSAKLFGAPIGAGFRSPAKLLTFLHTSPGPVKAVALVLIFSMAVTTFLTSKQMMGNTTTTDPSQQTQQRVLLYAMPAMLGLFGFQVAIGVLIYWTTTNLFSMVQQAVVIRHLGPVGAAPGKASGAGAGSTTGAGGSTGTRGSGTRGRSGKDASTAPKAPLAGATGSPAVAGADGNTSVPADGAATSSPSRRPTNRNNKRGKGQRRGGRR